MIAPAYPEAEVYILPKLNCLLRPHFKCPFLRPKCREWRAQSRRQSMSVPLYLVRLGLISPFTRKLGPHRIYLCIHTQIYLVCWDCFKYHTLVLNSLLSGDVLEFLVLPPLAPEGYDHRPASLYPGDQIQRFMHTRQTSLVLKKKKKKAFIIKFR